MKKTGFWKGFICGILLAMLSAIAVIAFANRGVLSTVSAEGGLSVAEATEIVTKYDSLLRKIKDVFLFDIDEELQNDMFDAGYSAFVDKLGDKYSRYFTKEQYEDYTQSMSGSFGGVGVTVRMNDESGYPEVVEIRPDSPAGKSEEIAVGDLLVAVDGTDLAGLTLDEAVALVRGEIGTKVDLTFRVPATGATYEVTLTRKKIETETVTGEMLEEDGRKIGYIHIAEFDQITTKQFKTILGDLLEQGAEALVLDVRNNPGGYLSTVVDITDLLVPEGIITYTLDKDGEREEYTSDRNCLDLPMALLTNGNSASASEILTGALKDYGVARVFGTTTFGKGIVQNTYRFADGSAIKLTISRFYSPKGVCFHGIGIEPDVTVELPAGIDFSTGLAYEDDTQLQAAVEYLLDVIAAPLAACNE